MKIHQTFQLYICSSQLLKSYRCWYDSYILKASDYHDPFPVLKHRNQSCCKNLYGLVYVNVSDFLKGFSHKNLDSADVLYRFLDIDLWKGFCYKNIYRLIYRTVNVMSLLKSFSPSKIFIDMFMSKYSHF